MKTMYGLRASDPAMSKAEALRQAQIGLLRGTDRTQHCDGLRNKAINLKIGQTPVESSCRWSHPYYWAPFMLIRLSSYRSTISRIK